MTLIFSNNTVENTINAQEISFPVGAVSAGDAILAELTNDQIVSVGNDPTYFYLQDQMHVFDNAIFLADTLLPGLAINSTDPARSPLKAYAFWRLDSAVHSQYNQDYAAIPLNVTISSTSKDILIFSISVDALNNLKSISDLTGIHFGFITFTIKQQDITSAITSRTFLMKATINPLFSTETYTIPPPTSTDGVFKTDSISFETFFVPTLSASFVYNFFEEGEDNFQTYYNRSYKNKRLSNIPKYNLLTWGRATSPVFGASSAGMIVSSASVPAAGGGTPISRSSLGSSGVLGLPGLLISTGIGASLPSIIAGGTSSGRSAGSGLLPGATAGGLTDRGGIGATPSAPGGVSSTPPSARDSVLTTITGRSGPADAFLMSDVFSDYAGYIIIKERYNEDIQDFEKIEDIVIVGKNTTSYVDTQIAYSETYRYSIRSIFQFINNNHVDIFLESDREIINTYDEAETLQGAVYSDTFFYDSVASDPVEITAIENIRPDAPDNLQIIPNSQEKFIFITWNQKNQNNDVAGFNVYRKNNENDVIFEKLNIELIQVRNNFYKDYNVEQNKNYIYAIEAIDQHGNFSTLSSQFVSSITDLDPEIGRVEKKNKLFKVRGDELYNPIIQLSPQQIIIFKKNLNLEVNPVYLNSDTDAIYVLRFTSLDTLQQKEVKLNFVTKIISHIGL